MSQTPVILGGRWWFMKGDGTGHHLLTGTQELKVDWRANQAKKNKFTNWRNICKAAPGWLNWQAWNAGIEIQQKKNRTNIAATHWLAFVCQVLIVAYYQLKYRFIHCKLDTRLSTWVPSVKFTALPQDSENMWIYNLSLTLKLPGGRGANGPTFKFEC